MNLLRARKGFLKCGALLLVLSAPTSAGAALIQVAFSGVITSVVDPGGAWGSLAVGAPFSGTLALDDSIPDIDLNPFNGLYADADGLFFQVELDVGGTLVDPIPGGVADVANAPALDAFLFGGGFSGPTFGGFEISLRNFAGTSVANDSLGGVPFDLAAWPDVHTIEIDSASAPYSITGDIQSLQLVPEPATALLLGAGLAALARGRRIRGGDRRRNAPCAAWHSLAVPYSSSGEFR